MKIFFLSIFCCLSSVVFAQNNQFAGVWQGKIELGVSLRLVFNFTQLPNGSYVCTWQSPDQADQLFSTDTCFVRGDSIFTAAKKYGIAYKGKRINDTTISGVFTQGVHIPLTIYKIDQLITANRPQTPVAPFPYHSEDFIFFNKDSSLQFGATLTYPKIPEGLNYVKAPTYPTMILISGSGPQDRDENILQHKPFAVIADALTKKGFAVLRYDDRGVGKSSGNFATANSIDFTNDAEAALNFLYTLPQIDTNRLGLIGHSEGGMIAPMLAAKRKDVRSMILLSAPGVPITQLMHEQIEAVGQTNATEATATAGADLFMLMAKEMNKNNDSVSTIKKIRKKFESWAKKADPAILESLELKTEKNRQDYIQSQYNGMNNPWFRYFLAYKPATALKKTTAKVLALNGSKDIQVFAASNLKGIEAALRKSKSKSYTIKEIPGLNHLYQSCQTCTIAEYGKLEESFSPIALQIMIEWLLKNND